MSKFVEAVLNKKASDINPSYKLNCFSTSVSYFRNEIINGCMTAEEMLKWLQDNTYQVEKPEAFSIAVVWFSSDVSKSPNAVRVNELLKTNSGYPFGLIMEHAAIFINDFDVFQKASPKDEDPFEIVNFQAISDRNYGHQEWVRFSYHRFL